MGRRPFASNSRHHKRLAGSGRPATVHLSGPGRAFGDLGRFHLDRLNCKPVIDEDSWAPLVFALAVNTSEHLLKFCNSQNNIHTDSGFLLQNRTYDSSDFSSLKSISALPNSQPPSLPKIHLTHRFYIYKLMNSRESCQPFQFQGGAYWIYSNLQSPSPSSY